MGSKISAVGGLVMMCVWVGCGSASPGAGVEGGVCLQGGVCSAGLVCVNGTCRTDGMSAGGADGAGGDNGSGGVGGSGELEPICGSSELFAPPETAQCVNQFCCDVVEPCLLDTMCVDCLTEEQATGCETNSLYLGADQCLSANCDEVGPTEPDFCGLGVTAEVTAACEACINANCCASLSSCVGQTDPQFDECLSCVGDLLPPAISSPCATTAANVRTDAEQFVQCFSGTCSAECSL